MQLYGVSRLPMKKSLKYLIIASFVIYCFIVSDIVLLSRIHMFRVDAWLEIWERRYRLQYGINLIPFQTIVTYIKSILRGDIVAIAIRNLAGNLLMFLPLGIYLPLIWKKCRNLKTTLLFSLTALIAIEILQFVTLLGSLDVDDLILNLLGIIIGYGLWKALKVFRYFNF